MKNRVTLISLWLLSAAGCFALGLAINSKTAPSTEGDSPKNRLSAMMTPEDSSTINAANSGGELVTELGSRNGFGPAPTELAKYFTPGSSTISADDMATAMKDMRRENDPLKRRAMFTELLERLDKDNAKSAFLALRDGRESRGGPWGGGGDEERLLLNAWGRIDGAGAVAELQAMEEARRAGQEAQGEGGEQRRGPDRGGFDISSVLRGWAMADAAGAIEHLGGVEDDRARGFMGGEIVRGLMVEGVDNALAFVGSLPEDDGARPWHMRTIAEEILEDGDVSSAADWATSLADDGLKEGAMRRVAESFAREDLQAAVAWVGEHGDQEYAHEAITQVAERWAESDPQATIEWATSLPAEAQEGAFREALDEWTERDPVAASQYLAEMPASEVKDSAIQGFATELSGEDPESAATWAATIGSEEVRLQAMERIARDYVRHDRTAAETWLPTSGLSAEQQQGALESRDRRWGR